MAGSGGDILPARRAPASSRRKALKWDVEYARYFATPRRGPSTPPPPGLRYISRGKLRHQGTWLPASTPAALCISQPSLPSAVPVLTVSIGGVAFEEHFVSILNFSWPQVTCVTQCPIRGSRVVFMSFCDKSKQIQKFAVRFPQLSDAESFLNNVKECSTETMDVIPSGSDYMCEDSSTSEYIVSNGHQLSYEEPAPALSYHEESDQPVPGPPLAGNIDNIYSGFPPSFSQMLTICSIENEKDAEGSNPVTAMNHTPQEVYALGTSRDVAAEASKTTADKGKDTAEGIYASKVTSDLMARIKTYMAEDSFHDMLFKLEKVIDELGGGMLL